MVNTEIDALHEELEEHSREIRRLKKWKAKVSVGDNIRSTSVGGSTPTDHGGTGIVTTAPMWYLWQNQSGAQRDQGTVVVQAGNRTFGVTTTPDDPLVIGVLDEDDVAIGTDALVRHIGFQPVVLTQGVVVAGHYLRASATAGSAEDAGTAPTAGTFGWALTASAGGASSVAAFIDTGLRHPLSGGGMSGTANLYVDGVLFCSSLDLNLQEEPGIWISGTCAGGMGTWKVGAYATAPSGGGMSGVDVALNGSDFCFASGLDLHEGAGVWISGSCSAGQADVMIGAYASPAPTSVSGVDWAANEGHLGFGNAADFRQGTGVWMSGTWVDGEAIFEVGAYPAAAPPTSISGVDFWAGGMPLSFDNEVDVRGAGDVWISGSVVGDRPVYIVGSYERYSPHAIILTVAGMVSGCYANVADFPLPAPFNFYLRELRIKARTAPSFDTVFRVTADEVGLGDITLPSGTVHAYSDCADVWITGGANLDLDLRSANWSGENFAVLLVGWAVNGRW